MDYSEKVMDHFANPRNSRKMEDANGVGTVGNPTCGDLMTIYIKVEDNVIQDISFQTFGCGAAISIAVLSVISMEIPTRWSWHLPMERSLSLSIEVAINSSSACSIG